MRSDMKSLREFHLHITLDCQAEYKCQQEQVDTKELQLIQLDKEEAYTNSEINAWNETKELIIIEVITHLDEAIWKIKNVSIERQKIDMNFLNKKPASRVIFFKIKIV